MQVKFDITKTLMDYAARTENCTSSTVAANVECVPSIIGTNLYYFGDEPTTFGEQLRQAILIWTFDIDGLLGFGEVQVEEVAPPEPAVNEPDTNSTTSNGTGTTAEPPPAASESAPTPGPRTRASPPVTTVAGIQNNESRDRSVNPGAFVAAAMAALALMLVAVFVAKRQRDRSTDSISKHREFHDDEDNDSDLGNETDDNTAMTPIPATTPQSPPPPQQRLAYIVGDDESWNTGLSSSAMGQEMLASPALTELLQHGPHVTCSSPNCEVCELKRQGGTKFVASSAAMDSPSREELPPRRYEAEDTVSL
jgi:hypothetical protein